MDHLPHLGNRTMQDLRHRAADQRIVRFGTSTFRVPWRVIQILPDGHHYRMVPTLTPTLRVSYRNKQPAIKLVPMANNFGVGDAGNDDPFDGDEDDGRRPGRGGGGRGARGRGPGRGGGDDNNEGGGARVVRTPGRTTRNSTQGRTPPANPNANNGARLEALTQSRQTRRQTAREIVAAKRIQALARGRAARQRVDALRAARDEYDNNHDDYDNNDPMDDSGIGSVDSAPNRRKREAEAALQHYRDLVWHGVKKVGDVVDRNVHRRALEALRQNAREKQAQQALLRLQQVPAAEALTRLRTPQRSPAASLLQLRRDSGAADTLAQMRKSNSNRDLRTQLRDQDAILAAYNRAINANPRYFEVGRSGLQIDDNEISRTVNPRWLNDELINGYFHVLEYEFGTSTNGRYMTSYWFQEMRGDKSEKAGAVRWGVKQNIYRHDWVYVPINWGDSHWCLAVLDVRQQVIHYFDPYGGVDRQLEGRALQDLVKCLKGVAKQQKRPVGEWKCLNHTGVAVQNSTDSINCGVYICLLAEGWSEGARTDAEFNKLRGFGSSQRKKILGRVRLYAEQMGGMVPRRTTAPADSDDDSVQLAATPKKANGKAKGKAKDKGKAKAKTIDLVSDEDDTPETPSDLSAKHKKPRTTPGGGGQVLAGASGWQPMTDEQLGDFYDRRRKQREAELTSAAVKMQRLRRGTLARRAQQAAQVVPPLPAKKKGRKSKKAEAEALAAEAKEDVGAPASDKRSRRPRK